MSTNSSEEGSRDGLAAGRLRELHQRPHWPLVLPNAWDAASARIFEAAGFAAIATSSAGVAYSLGYPDGQRVPRPEMIDAVRRIAQAVCVPVSADVEAGYDDAAATAQGLIEAGAAGLNIEDIEGDTAEALVPLDRQLHKLRAVRAAAPGIVLNARTDIYLAQVGDPASRFDRVAERLRAFEAEGADCVFVPGVRDEETIGRLAAVVSVPLNILVVAGSPPISRLRELGVGRVTQGSGPMRACMGLTRRIAEELRDHGTYRGFLDGAIPYAEMNGLFGR